MNNTKLFAIFTTNYVIVNAVTSTIAELVTNSTGILKGIVWLFGQAEYH